MRKMIFFLLLSCHTVQFASATEFSDESKISFGSFSKDSTNAEDADEEEYFADDEDEIDEQYAYLTDSSLAFWILDAMYNFKHGSIMKKGRIERHKIKMQNGLKPKVKLYHMSEHFPKTNRIFGADKSQIGCRKVQIENHTERKVKLYKMSENFPKTNRIFDADKKHIKEYEIKPRKLQEKSMAYKSSKNGFGNIRVAKVKIPIFIMGAELGAVGNLIRSLDTYELKPADIKEYLKKYGFSGDISPNWKRKQLIKKLGEVLQEKRELLLNRLDIPMKVVNHNDVYIMPDGNYLHIQIGGQNTLFEIDRVLVQLTFQGRDYELNTICENKMRYNTVENSESSTKLEMSLVISYEKIGESTNPYFGDVNVVGGQPKYELFVKILSNWHKKKSEYVSFYGEACTRKRRQKSYESWKLSY